MFIINYLLFLLLIGIDAKIKRSIHKIIGGWDARPEEFPFQVSLTRAPYGFHFCGGAIYDELHIITAAHCIRKPETIVVTAGSVVRGNNSETVVRNVITAKIHEQYDDRSLMFDIAILKLDEPLVFQNAVSAINLQLGEVEDGTLCSVSGWGVTNTTSSVASITLQVVEVPIIAQNACISAYKFLNPVLDNMICAGSDTGGKDACQGDSGGPLVCNETLTGIVSWGLECAHPLYPGVYTRISEFVDWIMRSVEALNTVNISEKPTSTEFINYTDINSSVSTEPVNIGLGPTVEADFTIYFNETTETNILTLNFTDFTFNGTNNSAPAFSESMMIISLNLIIGYTVS